MTTLSFRQLQSLYRQNRYEACHTSHRQLFHFEKLAKLVLTIKDIEICGLKSENVKMQISDFLKHHHKSMYVLFLFSVIHSLCNYTASGGAAEGRKEGRITDSHSAVGLLHGVDLLHGKGGNSWVSNISKWFVYGNLEKYENANNWFSQPS